MENQILKNDQQSTKSKCFNLTFGAAPFMHPQALEQWQGHEKQQDSNGGRKKEMKLNNIAGKRGQKM